MLTINQLIKIAIIFAATVTSNHSHHQHYTTIIHLLMLLVLSWSLSLCSSYACHISYSVASPLLLSISHNSTVLSLQILHRFLPTGTTFKNRNEIRPIHSAYFSAAVLCHRIRWLLLMMANHLMKYSVE